MAKQTFTTGQVLSAAQMTSLQQTAMGGGSATAKTASYVLVAADAGTTVIMNAAGATTITVNTGLFAAGDTVLIQNIGAGTTTVTAGTATVNTAGSLALGQYEAGVLYFTATGAAILHDYTQAAGTGGMTQIASTSLSSSATTISSIPSTYKTLLIVINALSTDSNIQLEFYVNGTTSGYAYSGTTQIGSTSATYGNISDSRIRLSAGQSSSASGTNNAWALNFYNYASTTAFKTYDMSGSWSGSVDNGAIFQGGAWRNAAAITSCTVTNTGANFDNGTITVFGVN